MATSTSKAGFLTAAAIVAMASGACSHRSAGIPTASVAPPAPVVAAQQEEAPTPAGVAHGTRKLLNVDVPVFVDGKQMGVLRYGELPPGVDLVTNPANELHPLRYYRVSDYLKAIGVDVNRVKAVHFADKVNRIASIEGSELRAEKDRFVFDFTATTGGMPEMAWNTVGMKTRLRVDYFYGVNVFVDHQPTEIDSHYHCYIDDGECTPVARFTTGDLMKGTRVYVDGKLVSYVKRRLLADSALAAGSTDAEPTFSTDKYLASLGIDTAHAKKINYLAGDKLIVSASSKQWAADKDALTFQLVQHAHGKVEANIPADLQVNGKADRPAQVTAIQVFQKKEPRDMPLVGIDGVIDFSALQKDSVASAAQDGP